MKFIKKLLVMLMLAATLCSSGLSVFAANVADATIDTSRVGSLEVYKYDLTNAERDGVWDSSYVSTGVKDTAGVNDILGNSSRVSDLGNGEVAYGYALKGVEFTYLRVADIRTYTETESGASHVEVLYGIPVNTNTDRLLSAIGLTHANRYAPADQTVGGVLTYYYQSDTLIEGLGTALTANSTTVKNALETYVKDNGGTAMPETDSYGKTSASSLPLGLYLVVETKVPEMVTSTTAPFFVSLPMTSVDGNNANDGGNRWIYDVCIYPKNLTGIPTLVKELREAKADTGHNTGSTSDITDGYAHTATASGGDKIEYQVRSTLPSITSEATYLTELTFVDTLVEGLTYNRNDVMIEIFTDAACTNKVATWRQTDSTPMFSVQYATNAANSTVMTVAMTAEGLREINANRRVYTGAYMVNSGFSDCTMRLTYAATVNSDATLVNGDEGNQNNVVLIWSRTNTPDYKDRLIDDNHLFSYGIDLTKQFSDNNGDYSAVKMLLHNDTDDYYVTAQLGADGIYYATGHVTAEADATVFTPTANGSLFVHNLEDDTYTITEVETDNGYTLLKDDIEIVITTAEGELCDWYDNDTLGVVQNDERYPHILPHLEHRMLTATATVDDNAVAMKAHDDSANAFAPLTVVNTKGFDLPRTGSRGTWMYPVVGLCIAGIAACAVILLKKKRAAK